MIALIAMALASAPAPGQAGSAPRSVSVSVLLHPVQRGDLLTAGDFEQQARPAAGGALPAAAAAAHEIVRNLPAGATVRAGDIVTPRLVRRGDPVTISLRANGLVIATGGRALSAGGIGDLVRVVSSTTSRTFDGVVEGSSAVRIAAH